MLEEDVVRWLYEGAQALLNGSTRMGDMEKALERASREVRRKALERLAQETADQQPFAFLRGHSSPQPENSRKRSQGTQRRGGLDL